MQDELNQLYDVVNKLLVSYLSAWSESIANGSPDNDDSQSLTILSALLAIRGTLTPLASPAQDTSHG